MAALVVTPNSRNSRPTTPGMNSTGMKTAASERVMVRMVEPTCRTPS